MGRPKGSLNKSTLIKRGILLSNGVSVPIEDTRTDDEVLEQIIERFDVFAELVKNAIGGEGMPVVVAGAPGIGKSYTAEYLLDKAARKQNIRYRIIKGKISAIELYTIALEYSGPHDVILLDDADSIFEDQTGLNLLKAMLDTSLERRVTWATADARFKGENALPREFMYRGTMIFLTNLNFQDCIDKGTGKNVEHMRALQDRSIYLDLKLHSRREVMLWVRHIVTRNRLLQQLGLSKEQEATVLNWLQSHVTELQNLSIRAALKVGRYMMNNIETWEIVAKMTMLRDKRIRAGTI